MSQGFEVLSKDGIAAAKKATSKEEAEKKADKSVEHTLLRKERLPPSASELKRTETLKREVIREDSAYYDKNRIAVLKGTCTRYLNHFGEKYPEIKKFPKPSEKDGLEEWNTYLGNIQNVIGGAKAGQRFDSFLVMAMQGVEHLNRQFPELFAGYSVYEPLSLAQVVSQPSFLETIDDEKHEIIFTHQSWFSSGYWSRLIESVGKVATGVAMKNREISMAQAGSPEAVDKLVSTPPEPPKPEKPKAKGRK